MSDSPNLTVRTQAVTAADALATRFPSAPARYVTFRCRTGSFLILGVNGNTLDVDGLTVAAGAVPVQLCVTNMNQLGYKAASPGEILEIVRSY